MECRVLEIDDLCLAPNPSKAGEAKPCSGITLKLNAGEIALVVGLEQVGKSRLLSAVAGISPSYGQVTVAGKVAGGVDTKRYVGYLPSGNALYRELTCIQYLSMFAEMYDVERHYRPYIMREALSLVHLEDLENTIIGNIEDEYKLRCLGLARALVHDPRLLVIDDVFSGIDLPNVRSWVDILSSIRNRGKAILLSGSQLGNLENLVDQVCYLDNYQPYLQGWLADIGVELNNHHLYQLQFLNIDSKKKCMNEMAKDKRVLSLRPALQDNTLLRIIFKGLPEEFSVLLRSLGNIKMQVVASWEDAAFFGRVN